MDESILSGFTTENSLSAITKEVSLNTFKSLEKYFPIYISKDLQKRIIKSIAQNLKGIIKENIQNNQMKFVIKSDIFYLNHFPPISIEDYINRIYKGTKMNISTLILSIIYIDRFCETNGYILSLNNVHRILLAACLLSLKFNEDVNIDAQYYANIAGVPINDLNNLECYLYVKLKFSLFVEYDFYQKYFEYFSKSIN
jgi:hypothetical protein